MRRRDFIVLLGSSLTLPAAHAQQVRVIGLFAFGSEAEQRDWTDAFVRRMAQLGWTEGVNLKIEYRWADRRHERFAAIADDLVKQKVDLIVTHNLVPSLLVKQATSTIPIVFATAADPVGNGIVASLARPGETLPACLGRHRIRQESSLNCSAKCLRGCNDWEF